ncbi:SRPBCC domain-containing protein [Luteimonas viscosa]|uniref:SRPBCC domain-containing protein n=1 Tax=Luteimonas viscosa TaxID=1132694 RepID=A0A5D4XPV9_9GAMM|nr:SRPBCC domain-containing protein [Luteimonas viscosa]TYT26609.1 SRPBCC domain-containing protein [Luteimonas viscosa]
MSAPILIRVTHRYAHPPERVFDAWLDPATVARFMFSTETGALVRCEIDPRVGGRFVMTDRRPDGDVEHVGHYLEIDRPHRLVFTFGIPAVSPDEDRITLEFRAIDGGCEVTLTDEMDPAWREYEDSSRKAWAKMLASLETMLA